MSKAIYFFFVDFLELPCFADRSFTGICLERDDLKESACGYTIVNFGDGESYLVIFVIAESVEFARKKLFRFVDKHGLKVMPMTLDWTKAQILVHHLNTIVKASHYVHAAVENVDEIDLSRMKAQVCRKIAQNRKWNRKFEELLEDIAKYERKPIQELKVNILNKCFKLNILPES